MVLLLTVLLLVVVLTLTLLLTVLGIGEESWFLGVWTNWTRFDLSCWFVVLFAPGIGNWCSCKNLILCLTDVKLSVDDVDVAGDCGDEDFCESANLVLIVGVVVVIVSFDDEEEVGTCVDETLFLAESGGFWLVSWSELFLSCCLFDETLIDVLVVVVDCWLFETFRLTFSWGRIWGLTIIWIYCVGT